MATVATTTADQRDALVERLLRSVLGFNDVYSIYIGDRIGLYAALDRLGDATVPELAAETGTSARYVREWLEQQAVAGFLAVDDVAAPADGRRYSLPDAHREVFLDRDSLAYLTPFMRMQVGMASPIAALVDAFRTGAGVPYRNFGADCREGIADMNRAQFVNLLGSEWLPSLPDVHARLEADPPARVADVACGSGWSTISLARAYPRAIVHGFDLDEASVELARANVAAEGLADRVRVEARDAGEVDGRYDLVTVFESLHDMARPVDALRTIRSLVADGGAVLVVDERVADEFTAPGDETEQLMYGWSVLHCLPVGLAEQPSAGTGTVMRVSTMEAYAAEAGFARVEVLPIENDFWRFYRLHH